MSKDLPWCIIINLQTCKESKWEAWKKLLEANHIPFSFHPTRSTDQLSMVVRSLIAKGQRFFLLAGGDGTLHHGGNLLILHAKERVSEIVIGVLPCGTGNDWFRSFGIPASQIIDSLKQKKTAPLHLLCLQWIDGRKRYAFNMVGGALDAAVVDSLNKSTLPIPGAIKYPIALLKTLTKPHAWEGSMTVDGKKLTGEWLTIQAGFGKYCGGGMYVLPHAIENQAALLLMKPKTLGKLITSLPKLYNGKIAEQKEAVAMHFSSIEINHSSKPIPIEADGEFLGYSPVKITTSYSMMNRLGNA